MHQINLPPTKDKKTAYQELIPQIQALVGGEQDLIANLSNIVAALKQTGRYFWVGFYLVKGNELVLGPFQGPVACTRITKDKGVCGAAWREKKVILVPDVEKFPGHIACNSASRSEIVLPVIKNHQVIMVLDVDSDELNDFDQVDEWFLTEVVEIVRKL